MPRVGIKNPVLVALAAWLAVAAAVAAPDASGTPKTATAAPLAMTSPVAAWGPVGSWEPGSLGGRVLASADGTRATVIYGSFNDLGDAGEYWLTRSASTSNGVLAWGPAQWASPQGGERGWQMALSKDGGRALYAWGYYGFLSQPEVIRVMARTITGNVGVEGPVQTLTTSTPGATDSGPAVAMSDDGSRAIVAWNHGVGLTSTTRVAVATVGSSATSWGPVIDLGMPAGQRVYPASVSMTGNGSQVTVGWSDLSSQTGTIQDGVGGPQVSWGPVTRPPLATSEPEGLTVSRDGSRLLALWNSGTSAAPRVTVEAATLANGVATWGLPYELPELNARASYYSSYVNALPSQTLLSEDGSTALVPVVARDTQDLNPTTSVDLLRLATDASITAGTHALLYRSADAAPIDAMFPSLSLSADGHVALATWGRYLWTATISGTAAVWHRPTQTVGHQSDIALSTDGSHAVAVWTVNTAGWPYTQIQARAGFPDSTAPVVRTTAPTATFTTSARIGVAWAANDGGSGVRTSAVRWTWVPATGGSWSPWAYPVAWSTLTSRSLTVVAALGTRYCFQIRSADWSGNTSAWTTSRCLATPFDDRTLSASTTWRRGLDPGWIAGTYSYTTAYGSRLSTVHASSVRQVGVIATSCRACGSLAVYVGRAKVGTLSLRSTTTRPRVLIALPRLTTTKYGQVRLVVTSYCRPVKIDAVVLSNT